MRNYGRNDIRNTERIPRHLLESLNAYVNSGRPLGKTMRAMVANDFFNGALLGADQETLLAMPAIIFYMYNDMPSISHGSYEVYELYCEFKSSKLDNIPTAEQKQSMNKLSEKLSTAKNIACGEYRTWNS